MATNVQGTQARELPIQAVHFLRKSVVFGDNATELEVGILPAGATILKPLSGVSVDVAFNAGTNNFLDVGTEADPDLYATDLALGSIAFVPLDEAVSMTLAADTKIVATVQLSGTAASAGAGEVIIAYVPDLDG